MLMLSEMLYYNPMFGTLSHVDLLLLLLILSKVYYRNQPYERAAAVVVSIERDPIIAIMFDAKPCERAAAATDSVESILSQSAVL